MGNRENNALCQAMDGAQADGLPADFQQALSAHARRGSVCAVSRVAQDEHGQVTHVEWGVTTPRLDDWIAGPRTASVADVIGAVAAGAVVRTLFPTGTGFACGPEVVVGPQGCFELGPNAPGEWNVWALPRLSFRPRLRAFDC